MNNKIQNAELAFVCGEDWNTMPVSAEGRFCNKCSKTVNDLTNKNVAYFNELLSLNSHGFCGRFTESQLATRTKHSYWKNALQTIFVFAGFFGWVQNAKAQDVVKSAKEEKSNLANDRVVLGIVKSKPSIYPQHLKKMHAYLVANCKFSPEDSGTVFIKFKIDGDGQIVNPEVSTFDEFFNASDSTLSKVRRALCSAPKCKGYVPVDPQKPHQDRLAFYITKGHCSTLLLE